MALLAAFYIERHFAIPSVNISFISVPIPFAGEVVIGGILFVLFVAFVIVGVSNAVNLTDGLDGLAGGVLIFSFVAYLLIALVAVPEGKPSQPNLAIFCALIIGALMGFLWFNVHPAQLFMGDSGALGMGATLAVVATITAQLPLLAVIGAVFFAVIMSVVLQVVSFRLRGTADLPDGSAAAPLRADRVGGGEDHGPLLDRRRAGRACSASASTSQPCAGCSETDEHHDRPNRDPRGPAGAPRPGARPGPLRDGGGSPAGRCRRRR